jgi:hypothetical protein
MIDVGRFARPNPPFPKNGRQQFLRFALDGSGAAAELRRFADALESGLIYMIKVQAGYVADGCDFPAQALMIEFVQAEPVEPQA